MRQFKYLILLFIFPQIIQAQATWAPVGATWYFDYSLGYQKVESIKDTLIDGVIYTELKRTNVLSVGTKNVTSLYTCLDNDTVFIYNEKTKKSVFLYDFKASKGDEWIIPERYNIDGCDSIGKLKVDSTYNKVIGATQLRVVDLSPIDSSHWVFSATNKIIERIGSLDYLIPRNSGYCGYVDVDELGGLRCYSDDEIEYSRDNLSECDRIVSLEGNIQAVKLQHYSIKTTSNSLTIIPNERTNHHSQLRLIDLNGRVRIDDKVVIGNAVSYSTLGMSPGVYILLIDNKSYKVLL